MPFPPSINIRHSSALNIAKRPAYVSLRFYSDSTNGNGNDSKSSLDPRQEVLSALAERTRILLRAQPHGLAAVVAPPKLSSTPIVQRWPNQTLPHLEEVSQSAMLVSSFNTVSLSPIPYVSFNIKTPSRTYENIFNYGQFTVSGLTNPATAQAFLKKDDGRPQQHKMAMWKGFVGHLGEVKSEFGGSWWLKCKFSQQLSNKVGDHMIVVGKVLEAGRERKPGGESDSRPYGGLVYLDGEYRYVGGPVSAFATQKPSGQKEDEESLGMKWNERKDQT